MGKEKNAEIGLLRGVAICCVVGIHTFSLGLSNAPQGGKSFWAYNILHTLLQFAVPCFIFISAILLSYNIKKIEEFKVGDFYKKKLLKIFIPYVIWSVIYLLQKVYRGQLPLERLFQVKSWLYWLAYGKAYTHLYYLSITLQMYIAAPLLIGLVYIIGKKYKNHSGLIVVVTSIIAQVGVYFLNRQYISKVFTAQATLMIWYLYIILIGIWIGFHYEEYKETLQKYSLALFGFTAISAFLYVKLRVDILNKVPINTKYYQMIWYAYVFGITNVLFYLMLKIKNCKGKGIELINKIGDYSFGIYLMHPILTYWLHKLDFITNSVALLGVSIVAYIVIIGISGFVTKWLMKNKWTAICLGDYRGLKKAHQ